MTEYDDGRCCTLGPGHEGPCVLFCGMCSGTGDCIECDWPGPKPTGCESCGQTGDCPWCNGKGELVDDVVVISIRPAGGLS